MSVMCADARTCGVACWAVMGYPALPRVPDHQLEDYYAHIPEWATKVKNDLKAKGCWRADPRESTTGQVGKMAVPSLGVKESNLAMVQTSWHRWNGDEAPMPNGTRALWRDWLEAGPFRLCDDRGVLWDPASWQWANPTWLISGVSAQMTKQPSNLTRRRHKHLGVRHKRLGVSESRCRGLGAV